MKRVYFVTVIDAEQCDKQTRDTFHAWLQWDCWQLQHCRQCGERQEDEWNASSIYTVVLYLIALFRQHSLTAPQVVCICSTQPGWQSEWEEARCIGRMSVVAVFSYLLFSHMLYCFAELPPSTSPDGTHAHVKLSYGNYLSPGIEDIDNSSAG